MKCSQSIKKSANYQNSRLFFSSLLQLKCGEKQKSNKFCHFRTTKAQKQTLKLDFLLMDEII